MTLEYLLWAIFAGLIGSLIVAVISWFFGLRKVDGRVDNLCREVSELKSDMAECKRLITILVDASDSAEIGKALKRAVVSDNWGER